MGWCFVCYFRMCWNSFISRGFLQCYPTTGWCVIKRILTPSRALPADAMWNLCMAINVYLTIFHKYTSGRLKKLEKFYLLFCYGVTFIIAIVCLFISTPARGKIYGPNILWCSIDIQVCAFAPLRPCGALPMNLQPS